MIHGLVSIVICTRNNWPDVEMTIQSALNQSYDPIEVIVVDSSSQDATPEEIPKRFGPTVQYARTPNRGAGAARNVGFGLTHGEFIQFVDGDDVLAPYKIQKQLEMFRSDPTLDVIYGDDRKFQTPAGEADWVDVETGPQADMLAWLIQHQGPPAGLTNPLCILFRRRVLEQVGPWDEELYTEDWDYWLRLAWAGSRFGHCSGGLMGFKRIRPGQKTADLAAVAYGREALWDKALTYITRQPYRKMVARESARQKLRLAFFEAHRSRRRALIKVQSARKTDRDSVPLFMYIAVCGLLVMPGARFLFSSRLPVGVRRLINRLPGPDRLPASANALEAGPVRHGEYDAGVQ
jgi:glycosyltransferase involved in cell wall biosynthesis